MIYDDGRGRDYIAVPDDFVDSVPPKTKDEILEISKQFWSTKRSTPVLSKQFWSTKRKSKRTNISTSTSVLPIKQEKITQVDPLPYENDWVWAVAEKIK